MRRILITGATGFIGSPLWRQLASCGHIIACLARRLPEGQDIPENVTFIKGDLALNESTLCDIKNFNPDVIVHLAWEQIPVFTCKTAMTNLNLAVNFFDKILSHMTIETIISTGSCWENGDITGPAPSHLWQPSSDFTWAKYSIYNFLEMRATHHGFSLIWARLFYVYGPGQRSGSLIPTISEHLIAHDALPELKSPNTAYDFVYVNDVTDALSKMCLKPDLCGNFNIGSGKSFKVSDIANKLLALHQDKPAIHPSALRMANDPEHNMWADLSALTEQTDWTPKHDIESGLESVLKSHYQSAQT